MASRLRSPDSSATRAPASTTRWPRGRAVRPIHRFRAPWVAPRARNRVPTGSPARIRVERLGLLARGDDHRAPGPGDQPGRLELAPHPARPQAAPAVAGQAEDLVVEVGDQRDDLAQARGARVGPAEAVDDAEDHQQRGLEEVGDHRGELVVVAELDLVDADRVVLVDHRDRVVLEERGQGVPHVQVARAAVEVLVGQAGVRRQRHLVLMDFRSRGAPADQLQVGTRPYLDPFLAPKYGRKRWDLAGDRFAAAMVLHEMAAGTVPYWGSRNTDPRMTDAEVTVDRDAFPREIDGTARDAPRARATSRRLRALRHRRRPGASMEADLRDPRQGAQRNRQCKSTRSRCARRQQQTPQ